MAVEHLARDRDETRAGLLEALYRRHRAEIYHSLLSELKHPEDAEDLTQAAFVNACRALRRGHPPDKPRAWLLTIAHNLRRRRFRDQRRRVREVPLEAAAAIGVLQPTSIAPRELQDAIVRLPLNQRAALVLRELAGLSYAQIAEQLHVSVASVQMLLFRARRALRSELERKGALTVFGLPLPSWLSNLVNSVGGSFSQASVAARVLAATALGTGIAAGTGAIPIPHAARASQTDARLAAGLTDLRPGFPASGQRVHPKRADVVRARAVGTSSGPLALGQPQTRLRRVRVGNLVLPQAPSSGVASQPDSSSTQAAAVVPATSSSPAQAATAPVSPARAPEPPPTNSSVPVGVSPPADPAPTAPAAPAPPPTPPTPSGPAPAVPTPTTPSAPSVAIPPPLPPLPLEPPPPPSVPLPKLP